MNNHVHRAPFSDIEKKKKRVSMHVRVHCLSGLWLGGLPYLSFLSVFLKLVCYVFPCMSNLLGGAAGSRGRISSVVVGREAPGEREAAEGLHRTKREDQDRWQAAEEGSGCTRERASVLGRGTKEYDGSRLQETRGDEGRGGGLIFVKVWGEIDICEGGEAVSRTIRIFARLGREGRLI